jgi:hypothetical protein
MGVVLEALAPGVKDGKKADLGAEVSRVASDGKEALRDSTKEDAVEEALVLKTDGTEVLGKGKDQVKVPGVEELCCPRLEPLGSAGCLTLRAVAVATGLVEEFLVAAALTLFHVAAESGSPAARDVAENPSLKERRRLLGEIRSAVLPDDIGHFGPMSAHVPDSVSRRSMGLGVDWSALVATWR